MYNGISGFAVSININTSVRIDAANPYANDSSTISGVNGECCESSINRDIALVDLIV